jgi:hypothetical protein
LDSGTCVEGGYIKGKVVFKLRLAVKKEGPTYLGNGKIRVIGFEGESQFEMKAPFPLKFA